MKDQISKRDWETISTYLDGQLHPDKRADLEARLQREPDLQVALKELSNTRNLLQSTPRLQVPRNFTLTPQMVNQRLSAPRLAPVFGWASALASLLLVLVFVGDLFSVGGVIPIALHRSSEQAVYATRQSQDASDDDAMVVPEERNMEESVDAGGVDSGADAEILEGEAAPPVEAEPEKVPAAPTQEQEMDFAAEAPASELPLGAAQPTESEEATIFAAPPENVEDDIVEPYSGVETDTTVISESAVITGAYVVTTVVQTTEAQMDLAAEKSDQALEEDSPNWQSEMDTIEAETQEPDQNQEMSLDVAEAEEALAVTRASDYILAAEVILALFVLASGIAWIYLRSRGG